MNNCINIKFINIFGPQTSTSLRCRTDKEVTLNIKSENQLKEISTFLDKKGDTVVNINFCSKDDSYNFKLKNNRNIDRKSINLIRSKEINAIIS